MAVPRGIVEWSGLTDFISANMPFAPGIAPSVCRLRVPPQTVLAKAGPLRWTYGLTTWTFPDCKLDSINVTTDASGAEVWDLTILARRWLWRETGTVSGLYNSTVMTSTGLQIRDGTEQRPQELAALCLDAMGETRYDVAELPDNTRPEIDWDYANPAESLAQLCDPLGCVPVLGLDNRVRIARIGVGAHLPTTDLISGSQVADPPDPPRRLVVAIAPTSFQRDFDLEPVAEELDGSIVPLKDVSYNPGGKGNPDGWSYADQGYWSDLSKTKAYPFADRSVYRWYRIKTPFSLPDIADPIEDLRRILPLHAFQNDSYDDDATPAVTTTGRPVALPPYVYGTFWAGGDNHDPAYATPQDDLPNKPDGLVSSGYQIDVEQGVVMFDEPVVELVKAPSSVSEFGWYNKQAAIRLRIACPLRDKDTGQLIREEYERILDAPSTDRTRYQTIEDVRLLLTVRPSGARQDNVTLAREGADYYLDAMAEEYVNRDAYTYTYPGLLPISPTGAVRQITWQIDGQGFVTTTASYNNEEAWRRPTHKELRLNERLRVQAAKAAETEAQKEAARKRPMTL
jgi:hypothetical protein